MLDNYEDRSTGIPYPPPTFDEAFQNTLMGTIDKMLSAQEQIVDGLARLGAVIEADEPAEAGW